MQDRYAGDIGDFQKLGLLRALVAGAPSPLRLGIVWYLTPGEDHNADGKHVGYLDPSHRDAEAYRRLDAPLYDGLARVVRSGSRSVAALEQAGVMPPGTTTFREPLTFAGLASTHRVTRSARRTAWFDDALRVTKDADVVFVDPDNGLRRSDHPTGPLRAKSEKYCYLHELAAFVARGQSVIAYHHADRSAPVPEQITRRFADMNEALAVEPLAAVRTRGGSTRLFLFAAAPAHPDDLAVSLSQLAASPWTSLLQVHWYSAEHKRFPAGGVIAAADVLLADAPADSAPPPPFEPPKRRLLARLLGRDSSRSSK